MAPRAPRFVRTFHPDKVTLKATSASVGQGQKGNLPEVRVRTGGGSGTIDVELTCDKASITNSLKTSPSLSGKFKAQAKNCTCDPVVNSVGECNGHNARLDQVATECSDMKTIKGSVDADADVIESFKINGSGTAVVQP